MSVRKLTKLTFAVLAASVLSAFASGLYGSWPALTASFAVSILSVVLLYKIVFGELYAELRDVRENCKEVFASMPVPAIELDSAGNVVDINDAALHAGVPPSAAGGPLTGLEEVAEGGKAGVMGLSVQGIDGETANLLFGTLALKKNGARSGALLIGVDDTRRLETELESVKTAAREAEDKLNNTIRELEEFALMAVKRELKMKQIREKLTELNERRGTCGGVV